MPRPFGLDAVHRPRLAGWALACDDIDAAIERARRQGYDPGDAIDMERMSPAPSRPPARRRAVRADLTPHGASAGRLYSAAELISHAADLCSDSAGLVNDNERRWRAFRQRVTSLVSTADTDTPT
jgi:hypothetical protein